jgi:inosine-uridine nucleoside N-ribohydrolase
LNCNAARILISHLQLEYWFSLLAADRVRANSGGLTDDGETKMLRHIIRLALLWLVCTGAIYADQNDGSRMPVVLSTDVGNEIDDQWTITYLLLQPRVDVLGIMSAHAPTITAPAGHTSYRILVDVVENRLGMRVHPPLIEGGSLPMENSRTPRSSAAVNFLIKISRRFSKDDRLTVLMIGAGTDIASAILTDPGIVDRIRIIQMGFDDEQGGNEFNVANDVNAVKAILDSNVPLVVGSGKVCRASLSLTFDQARQMLAKRGAIGAWLWEEYQAWYFRYVKPLRVNDFSKPWVIWDNITLAYVLGMTTHHTLPRARLRDDMTFEQFKSDQTVTWITDVDEPRMWTDFLSLLDKYQRKHRVGNRPIRHRLTFMLP